MSTRRPPPKRSHLRGSGDFGVVSSTSSAVAAGMLPAFLVGALGPLLRADLGFSAPAIGAAVSVFFVSSGLASLPGGRSAERSGAARALIFGSVISSLSVLLVAIVAHGWLMLAMLLILAGVANGVIQPAANALLSSSVSPPRKALAFGIKQSAVPVAGALAGLAVPLVGLTVGWRWAFAASGALGLAVVTMMPKRLRTRPTINSTDRTEPHTSGLRVASAGLLLLAIASGVASGTGNFMMAYLVEAFLHKGYSAAIGGTVLAVANATGIVTRIAVSWAAGRVGFSPFRATSVMLVVGSGGYVLLGFVDSVALLTIAAIAAFAGGWGWPPLVHFGLVEVFHDSPASATGVLLVGVFTGSVLGPPALGVVVGLLSFAAAWTIAGACALIAAWLVLFARRRLRVEFAA